LKVCCGHLMLTSASDVYDKPHFLSSCTPKKHMLIILTCIASLFVPVCCILHQQALFCDETCFLHLDDLKNMPNWRIISVWGGWGSAQNAEDWFFSRRSCTQVYPAAADPAKSSMTILNTTVGAAARNMRMHLQLQDYLGNFLTKPEHMARSAPLQLIVSQKRSSNIRAMASMLSEIIALQVPGSSNVPAAPNGNPLISEVIFLENTTFVGLDWNTTLLSAGTHELSVTLGSLNVQQSPTNVTITERGVAPAASRIYGMSAPNRLTSVAGVAANITMRPTDQYQNALLHRPPGFTLPQLPPASGIVTNWASDLTVGSFADLEALKPDDGNHSMVPP
jgi:hypothetical protein